MKWADIERWRVGLSPNSEREKGNAGASGAARASARHYRGAAARSAEIPMCSPVAATAV